MQTTTNYGLKKPGTTDAANIDDLNFNADKADEEIKKVNDKADKKVTKENGNAKDVTFADGQTFQAKYDSGQLKGQTGDSGVKGADGPKGADGLTTSVNGVAQVTGVITIDATNIKMAKGVAGSPTVAEQISSVSERVTVLEQNLPINGKIVLPINDKDIWLECANLTSTKTLAQIVVDQTLMNALAISSNAVDYMIRSTGAIMSAVVSNVTAMAEVGKSSYATTAFIANTTWATAILASPTAIAGLDASTPIIITTMSSNVGASGTASASSEFSGGYAWKAFNGDLLGIAWQAGEYAAAFGNSWLKFVFVISNWAYKFQLKIATNFGSQCTVSMKIQYSTDNANWSDLKTVTRTIQANDDGFTIETGLAVRTGRTTYYRALMISTTATVCGGVAELQIYGK